MSIRLKLIITFLAVALIPLLFVSALTYYNFKNSLESTRISQLEDLATFKAQRIEAYFSGLKADIEIAQGFYNIKKNLPVLARLAHDPSSSEFLASKKILDAQFQQMQKVLALSDIMLFDPKGHLLYASNGKSHSEDFWNFLPDLKQKAFGEEKNNIFFSDAFLYKDEGNKVEMFLTAPASDFNGAFIGVIAFEIDMAPIYDLIEDTTGLGETGETLIGKKFANQVIFLNPLRHDPGATLKKKINLGETMGGPIQEAVQGRSGVGQMIDYRGEKVIAAWRHLPLLDWGMVAKIDSREAFAEALDLRNLVIMLVLIISALCGIMGISIAQSIFHPIQKLVKGTEIIGRGNLDYQIGIDQKDELGHLSRSFDKMARDLKTVTASRDDLDREIAEHKIVRKALETSEARFRRLFEAAKDGILIINAETGQITEVNPFLIEMLGYSYEEFLGKELWEIGLFKDIAASKLSFLELQQKGYIRYEDLPFKTKDGRVINVEFVSNTYLVDHQKVIQCNIRDITARKQAEEALRESEQRVRRKLDSLLSPEGDIGDLELADIIDVPAVQQLMDNFYKLTPVPMAIIDIKGKALVANGWQDICTKFHRINPETCRHCIESDTQLSLGVTPGEFKVYKCKNNMWDIATPIMVGDKHFGNFFMGQIFFEDDALDYEFFRSQAKKYGFNEEEYIAALERVPRLSRKAVDEAMAFFLKLSQMISQMSYSNIKLARSLVERKKAGEQLQRSNENLEQFAYVASHDLQEPLRVRASYSQLLEKRYKEKLGQDADDFINFIVDAAGRMQGLINDLLVYSRAGHVDTTATEVDCNDVVRRVVNGMTETIKSLNGEVIYDDLPVLKIHESNLVQLFQNFIGNALKFHGQKAPRIHIMARPENDGWLFSVKDNGIGIEPQYREQIFQIFERLHSRHEYPGTGIGLSICKKIVENNGGRIWVESELGQGSTFYFTVPTGGLKNG